MNRTLQVSRNNEEQPRRVLVVDAEAYIRELLVTTLQRMGLAAGAGAFAGWGRNIVAAALDRARP